MKNPYFGSILNRPPIGGIRRKTVAYRGFFCIIISVIIMRYLLLILTVSLFFASTAYGQGDPARELGEHDARLEALDKRIDTVEDNLASQYSRFEVISGILGILITLIVVLMSIFQVINLSSVRQEAREARGEVRGEIDKIRDAADHIYQQRDRLAGDLDRFNADFKDVVTLSEEVKRSHEEIDKLKTDITELVRIFESRTREAEIIIANLRQKETSYGDPVPGEIRDTTGDKTRGGIDDFLSDWVSSDDENVRLIEAAAKGQVKDPDRLLKASRELLSKGKLVAALAGCEAVISQEPENGEAYLTLGKVLYASGEDDKAFDAYEEAVKLAPDNATALVNLGALCGKKGERDTAITYFERALKIDKNDGNALFNLGKELTLLGKTADAEKYLSKAVELQPERSECHFFLGLSCYEQGKYDKGILQFDGALSINPDDSAALLNRARCKAAANDIDGALSDLGNALKLAPYYRDEIEQDEVFTSLRKDKRYHGLIATDRSNDDDVALDIGVE